MPGYTRLFNRILDSTIWRSDSDTRVLWITMLAMANRDGVVEATIPGLADRARISVEQCESALERFQQPDKYSWSQEEEGRRIKVVDGGWFLINHFKYRALLSEEERREKTRLRVEKLRNANKGVTCVTSNASVRNGTQNTPYKIQAQSQDTKEDQKHSARKARTRAHFEIPSLGEIQAYCEERKNLVDPQRWFNYYTSNGWKVGRNAMKDWRAAVRTWEKNGYSDGLTAAPAVGTSEPMPGCKTCGGTGKAKAHLGGEQPCHCTTGWWNK